MNRETRTWFEVAGDGDQVEIKTFFASRIDPDGQPGFSIARVDRLKAFHLAISILSVIEREMRNSAVAGELPGVVVSLMERGITTVGFCSCGARQFCGGPGDCDNAPAIWTDPVLEKGV